jgi:hypothetical protein
MADGNRHHNAFAEQEFDGFVVLDQRSAASRRFSSLMTSGGTLKFGERSALTKGGLFHG